MFTRLVFIGLWTYVDDNGVGIDNWRLIAAELFPLEEDFATVSRGVRDSLDALAATSRILRYTVAEKAYLSIMNWDEHQKVDRPGKARYPRPDHPDAEPTTRENIHNAPMSNGLARAPFATPSRHLRETPSTGEGEKGRRGEEDQNPVRKLDDQLPADLELLAPLAALAPLGSGLDTASSVDKDQNAGQIVREWIDFCNANSVIIPPTTIKRFGAEIKRALGGKVPARIIRSALGEMFRDRVMTRPALLDKYILRVQQGPELPPRRIGHAEAGLLRMDEDPAALFLRTMMNGAS
jgi:hypothetical protein